jgi:tetratricopeptide (TPR) repeat protein
MQNFDEAMESLNKSIKLDPDFPSSKLAKGYLYILLENYEDALKIFNNEEKNSPENGELHFQK